MKSWTNHLSDEDLHQSIVAASQSLETLKAEQTEIIKRIAKEESYQQDVLREFAERWKKKIGAVP